MNEALIDAAILGVVEGVTEFIPVSSTGHLILAGTILGSPFLSSGVFEVFIQAGSILAVMCYYVVRVMGLARGVFVPGRDRDLLMKILIAFFPAALVGVLLHGFIKGVLFSPWVVAVALIVGGFVMLWVERRAPKSYAPTIDHISFKTALQIGLCQLAALIPGVSRAGASIVGAQFFGVSRPAATEFSFFLAIPTILGAATYDLYRNFDVLTPADLPIFTVGFIAAFISALIVIRWLIRYVSKHGFAPFAYYRIVAGAVMLGLLSFGVLA